MASIAVSKTVDMGSIPVAPASLKNREIVRVFCGDFYKKVVEL